MDKSRLDDETVLVGFELPAAVAATSVSLVGDFNDWSPATHPLTPLEDGRFRAEVALPAGQRWRFRYLLDGGRWENDWAADAYEPNGLGADNSVVDLTSPGGISLAALQAAAAQADAAQADAARADAALAVADPATSERSAEETAGSTPEATTAPKRRWWRFWGRRAPVPAQA